MTRQAVSKQVLKLEYDLGARLFSRTTGTVMLTDAGKIYLNFFQTMYGEWEKTRIRVQQVLKSSDAWVNVGYVSNLDISKHLEWIISRCREDSRELKVFWERRDVCDLLSMLFAGKLDIIITYDVPPYSSADGAEQVVLETAPSLLAVSVNHPKVREGAVAKDFEGEVFLTTWKHKNESDEDAKRHLIEGCTNIGLLVTHVSIMPNPESLQTAVEMGNGVSMTIGASQLSRSPRITTFPIPGGSMRLVYMWRQGEQKPVVRQVIEKIKSSVSEKQNQAVSICTTTDSRSIRLLSLQQNPVVSSELSGDLTENESVC